MSVSSCISALGKQGVEIGNAEAKLISDDVDAIKDYADKENIPLSEAVEISIQSRRKDAAIAKAAMKRNQLLNFEAMASVKSFINENYADDPAMGIQVLLTGSQVDRKGAKNAISVKQDSLADRYLSTLMQMLQDVEEQDHIERAFRECCAGEGSRLYVKVEIIPRVGRGERTDLNTFDIPAPRSEMVQKETVGTTHLQ